MTTEARVFGGMSAVLYAFAVSYGVLRDVAMGGVDWAGVGILGLGATHCAMAGMYLAALTRRPGSGPKEDSGDQMSSGGRAAVRYRRLGLAGATAAAAVGLVHQSVWLIAVAVVAIVTGTSGRLSTYHTGTRRAASCSPRICATPHRASRHADAARLPRG
jgi:hypothetical protein